MHTRRSVIAYKLILVTLLSVLSTFTTVQAQSARPIVVFIAGLNYVETPEWNEVINIAKAKGLDTQFWNWSKYASLQEISQGFKLKLLAISRENPEIPIIVIGHCSGGVLSIMAFSDMQLEGTAKNIFVHTIASPLFGYDAPSIGRIVSPFIGKATFEIGFGLQDIPNQLSQCQHWVTIDCSADKHACRRGDIYPQRGVMTAMNSKLPCKSFPVQYLMTTHLGALTAATTQILKDF
jgi:hypothetical protein